LRSTPDPPPEANQPPPAEPALFKVNKTSTYGSSGKTYVKDLLQVGSGGGAVQIGDDGAIVDIDKADSLGLNGRKNPNTNSDFYLMRGGAWTKAMARGTPWAKTAPT
jgi:hypothetical protein